MLTEASRPIQPWTLLSSGGDLSVILSPILGDCSMSLSSLGGSGPNSRPDRRRQWRLLPTLASS
jgi:hypothetical protein